MMSGDAEGGVDNVLAEAQALMEEMGTEGAAQGAAGGGGNGGGGMTESIVIGGFSIDDDDDDEDVPRRETIIDARTKVTDDPLSVGAVAPPAAANQPSALPQDTVAIATTDDSNRRSSLTLHPLQEEAFMGNATTLTAPTFSDVKAKASGFASSMATFAQKAANSVAAAAAGQTTPNGTTVATVATGTGLPLSSAINNRVVMELDKDQKAALIEKHMGKLLPGEKVIMFLSNLLHVSDSSGWDYASIGASPRSNGAMWCCCMTYYRVVLFYTTTKSMEPRPINWNPLCWPETPAQPLQLEMPLASVDRVEKSIYTTAQNTTLMGLVLYGKDNGRQLRFTTPSYADTLRVHESINTYAFPGRRNLGYLFAFESKRDEVMSSVMTDPNTGNKTITLEPTRKRFDAVAEFGRQFGHMQPSPWTLYTKTNSTYQLSMSYPSIIVGPSSLPEPSQETQRILRQSAAFRSEQRLPALTWSNGQDGASLWRASQPKVGLQGNRSAADEQYIQAIYESAFTANKLATNKAPLPPKWALQKLTGSIDLTQWIPEQSTRLKILDLRPRSSAMANRTSGYGYENTSNYVGCTLQFCGIGNIHAVRDSYNKLSNVCNSQTTNDSTFNSSIEDSKWLGHLRTILAASWEAAYWMHVHRLPVFLHCSHGWDRTSQTAVIAQLIVDPYYRSMDGFVTLVEKDFLSFGHPFHTRCGHGEGRGGEGPNVGDDSQISPIFIQFLDCVYQIVRQFPSEFEITPKYLLELSEHIYSCRFGTLLCDTERERELVAGIRQRTHSVWDYLETVEGARNPNWSGAGGGVLLMPLPLLLRNVTLWVDRHCKHGPKPTQLRTK